jgi:hypothetical protein
MDSFELNKVMGAVLATCLFVLSLNIAAGAVFAPPKMEKPGYVIAVPDAPASGGGETAKAEPAEPLRSASRAPIRRKARPRPSNAPPATPSRRAVRTAWAQTFMALWTVPRVR